jgi:phage FluMu protein Com
LGDLNPFYLRSVSKAMPVRFRCSYCNQLLGISRRKIGLPVKCPTCQGQVIVPAQDSDEKGTAAAAEPIVAPQRHFEQSDFVKMLEQPPAAAERPRTQQPMLDFPIAASDNLPEVDVEPVSGQPATAGIVLTPKKLTLLIVVIIVALALAFAGGVLVGMAMGGSREKTSPSEESIEYPRSPLPIGGSTCIEIA